MNSRPSGDIQIETHDPNDDDGRKAIEILPQDKSKDNTQQSHVVINGN